MILSEKSKGSFPKNTSQEELLITVEKSVTLKDETCEKLIVDSLWVSQSHYGFVSATDDVLKLLCLHLLSKSYATGVICERLHLIPKSKPDCECHSDWNQTYSEC